MKNPKSKSMENFNNNKNNIWQKLYICQILTLSNHDNHNKSFMIVQNFLSLWIFLTFSVFII